METRVKIPKYVEKAIDWLIRYLQAENEELKWRVEENMKTIRILKRWQK